MAVDTNDTDHNGINDRALRNFGFRLKTRDMSLRERKAREQNLKKLMQWVIPYDEKRNIFPNMGSKPGDYPKYMLKFPDEELKVFMRKFLKGMEHYLDNGRYIGSEAKLGMFSGVEDVIAAELKSQGFEDRAKAYEYGPWIKVWRLVEPEGHSLYKLSLFKTKPFIVYGFVLITDQPVPKPYIDISE